MFFKKKSKDVTQVCRFDYEKLNERLMILENKIIKNCKSIDNSEVITFLENKIIENCKTVDNSEVLNTSIRKIEKKQKEMSALLEEINDFMQNNDDDKKNLLNAFITSADSVESFYQFARNSNSESLLQQAQMMWGNVKKQLKTVGVNIIDNEKCEFDFNLHYTENTVFDSEYPNGYVILVLKYGYLYNGKVIRKAAVAVNKNSN